MLENKTVVNKLNVDDFVDGINEENKRLDTKVLKEIIFRNAKENEVPLTIHKCHLIFLLI